MDTNVIECLPAASAERRRSVIGIKDTHKKQPTIRRWYKQQDEENTKRRRWVNGRLNRDNDLSLCVYRGSVINFATYKM